jgi:hypothetical protein
VLQNLSLNYAQVIMDPGGFIVNTVSHQHAAGPVNMYEVYHSFSSSLQPMASNFLSVSLSQSSASIGSAADANGSGLVFWKSDRLTPHPPLSHPCSRLYDMI